MQKQVNAWAEKNKVEVNADFITGNGNKLLLTGVAESQAKTGHDVYTFYNWDVYNIREFAGADRRRDGAADSEERRGERDRRIPRQGEGPLDRGAHQFRHAEQAALRADQLVQEARARRAGDVSGEARAHRRCRTSWTYEALLKYAELAQKDDMTFALGLGGTTNTDGIDQVGAMFKAFGAELIDADRATCTSIRRR